MPTPTYDLIASNVLSSSASSVTFSSIPATYRDLILVFVSSNSVSTSGGLVRVNGLTTSIYNYVYMQGNGTTASSVGNVDNQINITLRTTRNLQIMQFMDYAVTDKHKTVLIRNNDASVQVEAEVQRIATTAAINQIAISAISNQIASGSTFYLYGIVS